MTEETKQKIQKISTYYGYESQSRQCIEEMAELTQGINKMWRKSFACGLVNLEDVLAEEIDKNKFSDEKEYQNVIEEIADVQIMLWQLEYLLNADTSIVIQQKLDRQMERLGGNEYKRFQSRSGGLCRADWERKQRKDLRTMY